MRRRDFITAVGTFLSLVTLAQAETYPSRPVRLIVGFPPGGTTDVVARVIGKRLSERFGVPFVVENVPGAGANLGVERVVKSPADGLTMLVATPNLAINQFMYAKIPFDPEKDITPLSQVVAVPNLLCVKTGLPVSSVAELIAYAKANPDKLNYASSGIGTSIHLSAELFKSMTGTQMRHVAYRGSSQALIDLVGGSVDLMFDNMPTAFPLAREGKIRPLGVTTLKRSSIAPEFPAISETVPGFDATSFFGIAVRSGTPQDICDRIERDVRAICQEKPVRDRFAALSVDTVGSSGKDFTAYIASERAKWGKLIGELKIKAD